MRTRPLTRVLDEHWLSLPDRSVRSLRAGVPRAGAPPLVLVPGLGALGYLVPLVLACAAWTRVHLLDVPGFGQRRTARSTATLAAVSDAVAGWIEASFDRPVLLMGHSTGAQAALRATTATPDRVGALVLGGPTFPPSARRVMGLAGSVLRTLPAEHPAMLPAAAPEYLRGRQRLLQMLRDAMADAPERRIPDVDHPLLVISGQRDAIAPPSWGAQLAADAARGRCELLSAGHNFPFTHPVTTSLLGRRAVAG